VTTVDIKSHPRTFPLYVVLALLGVIVTWYLWDPNGSTINDKAWSEEVKLASGDLLHVRRHVRFREETALGGGYSTGQAFESSDLQWSTPDQKSIRWSAPMRALFLDREPNSGEWIIVAGGDSGANFYQLNGSPCPPQWAFRLKGDTWYVQPVPASLMGRMPNILLDLRVTDDRRFPFPSFDTEVKRRKERFAARPRREDLGLYVVGAIGVVSQCKGVPSQFRGPFTTNETIPGISDFPRIP
jgi:hypothetical protein